MFAMTKQFRGGGDVSYFPATLYMFLRLEWMRLLPTSTNTSIHASTNQPTRIGLHPRSSLPGPACGLSPSSHPQSTLLNPLTHLFFISGEATDEVTTSSTSHHTQTPEYTAAIRSLSRNCRLSTQIQT